MEQCFYLEMEKGKPYLSHSDINIKHLSAAIKISGDHKGAFIIALSEKDAKKMASMLILEEKRFLDKDVMDAMGEIINMISGSAKSRLADMAFKFKLNVPAFVLGKGTRLFKSDEYAPYICVPFHSDVVNFTIQVSLK
ncbi:MAG: chemotaxis protein CheX [Mucispirillum sp.]|nr:chemotaxis protein CheX [Mucispirillum sp.]